MENSRRVESRANAKASLGLSQASGTYLMPCGKVHGGKSSPRLLARATIRSPEKYLQDLSYTTLKAHDTFCSCKETQCKWGLQFLYSFDTIYVQRWHWSLPSVDISVPGSVFGYISSIHGEPDRLCAWRWVGKKIVATYQRIFWVNQDKALMVHMKLGTFPRPAQFPCPKTTSSTQPFLGASQRRGPSGGRSGCTARFELPIWFLSISCLFRYWFSNKYSYLLALLELSGTGEDFPFSSHGAPFHWVKVYTFEPCHGQPAGLRHGPRLWPYTAAICVSYERTTMITNHSSALTVCMAASRMIMENLPSHLAADSGIPKFLAKLAHFHWSEASLGD